MRLFLDAHLSGRRVAESLRRAGHDVLAADEERALDGWRDDELLALAADQGRILVTCDVKDFPRIARGWAEAGRGHAGCTILVGIDHSQFGVILRTVAAVLEVRPDHADWHDYTCFVSRPGPP